VTLAACLALAITLVTTFATITARRDKARPTFRGDDATWFRHRDYVAEAMRQLDYGLLEGHVHPIPNVDRERIQRRLHDAGIDTVSIGPAGVDAGLRLVVKKKP
jgi:hypothetical protein